MNQLTIGEKIRQKISDGKKLSKNEKNYIESLLPQKNGLKVQAHLKSITSRYRNYLFIFEESEKAQKYFHEILSSERYTKELGKYHLQVKNNLVYSIVRGRRLERVQQVIQNDIINKPIVTAALSSLEFALDKLLIKGCDLSIELQWHPDQEILEKEKQMQMLTNSLFTKKEEEDFNDQRMIKKIKNEVCTLTKQELLNQNASIKQKVKQEISLINGKIDSCYLID